MYHHQESPSSQDFCHLFLSNVVISLAVVFAILDRLQQPCVPHWFLKLCPMSVQFQTLNLSVMSALSSVGKLAPPLDLSLTATSADEGFMTRVSSLFWTVEQLLFPSLYVTLVLFPLRF